MEGRYEYGHYVAPNGMHYDTYEDYRNDIKEEKIMNLNVNNVTVAANTTSNTLKEDNIMNNMTVAELRKEAKKAGITGYSRMRKVQLISILSGTSTVKKDNKEELWNKLLLSVQKEYMAQSYKKRYKALFYRGNGEGAVYHVLAKRLWAVTALVIDKTYGKGVANEKNVLQTVDKLLERGIISKLEEVGDGQTRYYATAAQMNKMFFTVHPKKEVK